MITINDVKFIKGLALKKNRIKHECFIVEGEKNVSELLDSNFDVVSLYAIREWECDKELSIVYISNRELQRISSLKSPNKVLAVAKIPNQLVHKKQSR